MNIKKAVVFNLVAEKMTEMNLFGGDSYRCDSGEQGGMI
jgi:hypothetical protein